MTMRELVDYSTSLAAEWRVTEPAPRMPRAEANLYAGLPDASASSEMCVSYIYLERQIVRQAEHIRRYVTFEPFEGEGEPYRTSADMRADVARGHLYYLRTDVAADLAEGHPMLRGVTLSDGTRWVLNDLFRAVHDVMGHAVTGSSFGPKGEEVAWRAHRRTMDPRAHLALYCETRGQNVWTNYGPHMWENPHMGTGYRSDMPLSARPFAEQRIVYMPAWA